MNKSEFINKNKISSDSYLVSCIAKCIINSNKKDDIYNFYNFNKNITEKKFINDDNLNKDSFEIKQDENNNDVFFINNIAVDEQTFFNKLEKQTK